MFANQLGQAYVEQCIHPSLRIVGLDQCIYPSLRIVAYFPIENIRARLLSSYKKEANDATEYAIIYNAVQEQLGYIAKHIPCIEGVDLCKDEDEALAPPLTPVSESEATRKRP